MLAALLPSVSPDDARGAVRQPGSAAGARLRLSPAPVHRPAPHRRPSRCTSSTRCSASSCSAEGRRRLPPRSGARRSIAPPASSSRAAISTPRPRSTSRRRRGRRSSASRCTPGARCSPKAARKTLVRLARRDAAGDPRCGAAAGARRSLRGDVRRARARKALLERAYEGFVASNDVRRQLIVAARRSIATTTNGRTSRRSTAGSTCSSTLCTPTAVPVHRATRCAFAARSSSRCCSGSPSNPRIDDAARGRALLDAPDIVDVPRQRPRQRRVDPVQLLQLEDEGRQRRRADRARRAVARRPAGHRGQPRVVAGAPRVQRADPRPLRDARRRS